MEDCLKILKVEYLSNRVGFYFDFMGAYGISQIFRLDLYL